MEMDLDTLFKQDFFSDDDITSDLESVIKGIERHGHPATMRQSRAIAYARSLCPESELIKNIEASFQKARFNAILPDWIERGVNAMTLGDRIVGKMPISKIFGGQEGVKK